MIRFNKTDNASWACRIGRMEIEISDAGALIRLYAHEYADAELVCGVDIDGCPTIEATNTQVRKFLRLMPDHQLGEPLDLKAWPQPEATLFGFKVWELA